MCYLFMWMCGGFCGVKSPYQEEVFPDQLDLKEFLGMFSDQLDLRCIKVYFQKRNIFPSGMSGTP